MGTLHRPNLSEFVAGKKKTEPGGLGRRLWMF